MTPRIGLSEEQREACVSGSVLLQQDANKAAEHGYLEVARRIDSQKQALRDLVANDAALKAEKVVGVRREVLAELLQYVHDGSDTASISVEAIVEAGAILAATEGDDVQ